MRLRSEKVRLLYANIWQPVSAGILGALVLAAVMRNVVDTAHVVMWFIVLLAVSAWRLCDAPSFFFAVVAGRAGKGPVAVAIRSGSSGGGVHMGRRWRLDVSG